MQLVTMLPEDQVKYQDKRWPYCFPIVRTVLAKALCRCSNMSFGKPFVRHMTRMKDPNTNTCTQDKQYVIGDTCRSAS